MGTRRRLQAAARAGLRRLPVTAADRGQDQLTGLLNRQGFFDAAEALLRQGGETYALLLLDLDRFKEINDSLGHRAGDVLLSRIAPRLSGHTRPGDVLARLGGDEFAMVIAGADETGACSTADYLRSMLREPLSIAGMTVQVDASVGVALYPDHGNDLETLLRHADIAMYQAKARREGSRLYRPSQDDGLERLVTIEELRRGIRESQVVLHYQPKVNLPSGEVTSVEALARWAHPTRGLLYPDAFLDLAETSGLMPELTDEVLRQALQQCTAWWRAGWPVSVAVNLSASTVINPALPGILAERLSVAGLPPRALQVEITEEVILADRAVAKQVIEGIRALGVEVALDDFGSGYSSLAYLRELPVDVLKLDRSFVMTMSADRRAAALVHSAVELAHSLGLRMVAEGVEDAATLQRLTAYGCDTAQGFHMCRPVPAPALEQWVNSREGTDRAALSQRQVG